MSRKIHFVIHLIGYQTTNFDNHFTYKYEADRKIKTHIVLTARCAFTHEVCITSRNEQVESFDLYLLCKQALILLPNRTNSSVTVTVQLLCIPMWVYS